MSNENNKNVQKVDQGQNKCWWEKLLGLNPIYKLQSFRPIIINKEF